MRTSELAAKRLSLLPTEQCVVLVRSPQPRGHELPMTIGQNGPGSQNWPGGRLAWFQITIVDTDDLGHELQDADYSIFIGELREMLRLCRLSV